MFLEIGIRPGDLANFGVTVVSGVAYSPDANDEIMLGWRAAANLGGDQLRIGGTPYRIVGLYSTGQALGDTGATFTHSW